MNYLFGIHAIESALKINPGRIKKLMIDAKRQDNRLASLLQLARSAGLPIEYVDKIGFEKRVGKVTHQGVIAECQERKKLGDSELDILLNELQEPAFLLILDAVQDPHNLGACLRSGDAVGIQALIVPKDNSAEITGVVEKVASGAAETVPFFQVTNLARTMRKLQERNIWLYGLEDSAKQSIYEADLTGSIALVLGAEGVGLRRNTANHCDALYAIPMRGTVPSLNVSVAAGVCLFEALRQRH